MNVYTIILSSLVLKTLRTVLLPKIGKKDSLTLGLLKELLELHLGMSLNMLLKKLDECERVKISVEFDPELPTHIEGGTGENISPPNLELFNSSNDEDITLTSS